jgi:hypothetical protein
VQYDNGEHKHACYIRLRQREDETFEPAWEPAQAADHFDAYKPFLFATVKPKMKISSPSSKFSISHV